MRKGISMIIRIDDCDICFFEFFDDWKIDFWGTEYISLQYNLHIESSFFGSDNRISQLRGIRPGIYLDPDAILCPIDTRDESSLRMRIGE